MDEKEGAAQVEPAPPDSPSLSLFIVKKWFVSCRYLLVHSFSGSTDIMDRNTLVCFKNGLDCNILYRIIDPLRHSEPFQTDLNSFELYQCVVMNALIRRVRENQKEVFFYYLN